ncbi:MAG: invasion associated locus B family protein [Alphaproteobacteria bacterium]|nr:invasion associated locus B family protein [Alphaproteobacteria bacterium]
MRGFIMFIFSVFVLSALMPVASHAADDKAWDVRCKKNEENGKEYCEMFQMVMVKDTGQRFVEIAFFEEDKDKIGGIIVLPLGLMVAKPVLMQVDDGKKMAFNFHTCTPGGCLARINATKELMDQMRKGNKLMLATHSQMGKEFNVQLSLKGFSAAYKELQKKK